jgi:hypothetical protein
VGDAGAVVVVGSRCARGPGELPPALVGRTLLIRCPFAERRPSGTEVCQDPWVNLRRLLPALALGALLAGCGGSGVSAGPLAPHALDGPDYSGYLAAVEGIPFFRGPHAAATAACERKARGDMTREEAIDFVARAMAGVGFGRPEAQRTIDAVDEFNVCPSSTTWES